MQKKILIKWGIGSALLTAGYINLVVILIANGEKFFGGKPETIIIPIAMLLLFVISATITASLVLGKPLLLYLEGQKREAVFLLGATLASLVVVACILFFVAIV